MCVAMFSISILCYFNSHHSCFIYVNCSAVAMVLEQKKKKKKKTESRDPDLSDSCKFLVEHGAYHVQRMLICHIEICMISRPDYNFWSTQAVFSDAD